MRQPTDKKNLRRRRCYAAIGLWLVWPWLAGAAQVPKADLAQADMAKGEAVVKGSDCLSCHAADRKLVGPSFQEIAERYAAQQPQIVATLAHKIKQGGMGNWGQIPMLAHPQLADADIDAAVVWILAHQPAKPGSGAATAGTASDKPGQGAGTKHSYKNAQGETISTDFPVYLNDKPPQVTEAIFKGYEQYNSYCFRCHGGDAIGGDLAPDLRESLSKSMDWNSFLSVAMAGRQEKGMPSWAGFFEEKDLREIYEYIKARQLDLVPPGRPASAQD
ncbi:MAG: c-type cytochrome [Dyella sp.]